MNYTCPVCGFDRLDEPPYSSSGHGLFEICPCCGFQFGVTDDDQGISFHEWREPWIERGMPWDEKGHSSPTPDWNPQKQLQRLKKQANNTLNDSLIGNQDLWDEKTLPSHQANTLERALAAMLDFTQQ